MLATTERISVTRIPAEKGAGTFIFSLRYFTAGYIKTDMIKPIRNGEKSLIKRKNPKTISVISVKYIMFIIKSIFLFFKIYSPYL